MKTWKKGVVIGAIAGIVLGHILIIITFGLYTPPFGVGSNPINFWIFHLGVGGTFGALFVISIDFYGKYEKKVNYKYPLGGFILLLFGGFIIGGPFFLLSSPIPLFLGISGLYFGYMVGRILENRKNDQKKKREEN